MNLKLFTHINIESEGESMRKKIISIGMVLLNIGLWKLLGSGLSNVTFAKAKLDTDFDYSEIDAYIQDEMKSQKIPGLALGIIKDGEIVQVKGYGQSCSSGETETADIPFMIGSNSKSFTSVAVLQLA